MSSEIWFQRGLGIFLAFWLFLHVGVECELEGVFQKCCAIGRNKSAEPLKCDGKLPTPIPGIAIEQQSICLSTIDLCCIQSLRDIACDHGKKAAIQNKNCNVQPRNDEEITYKHCCEACKLGLISASMLDEGCKPKNFHFGPPWDSSYESCCSDSAPTAVDSEPRDLCQLLPGELCSHTCVPVGGSYKCQCRSGYALMADGKSCRQDTVENRCEKYVCDQNCYDNGETLECSCNSGYELLADNKTCVDINECNLKLDNCMESGKICLNKQGSFECIGNTTEKRQSSLNENKRTTQSKTNVVDSNENKMTSTRPTIICVQGYQFDVLKNTCVDVNECEIHNPCNKNTETCFNTPGSYSCIQTSKCSKGFVYNAQVNGCVDINECQDNPCASNEICQNQIGSYICTCKTGFHRDGLTLACVDVNECQLRTHQCPETSRCDNTVGSYQCTRSSGCGTGYTLNLETGACEDDNECAIGIDNCKLLGPEFECKNIVGSFRCEKKRCSDSNPNCGAKISEVPLCLPGYTLVKGECVDIDECARGKHSCRSTETCANTKGGYKCLLTSNCASGLRHNNEQTNCVDIDECVEQPSICDHNCINIWSSFFCTCNPGYRLHSDNRSCIDINECEVYKDRRLCIGYCVNTPGSYKCECPNGYRLGRFGNTCEDIDECATKTTCNQPSDICVNMRGSYRCNTITCPPNYIQDSNQKNRCIRVQDFCMLNKNCTNWPTNYIFAFFALTSDFPISTSGQMEFYRMKGPSSPSVSSQFSLELKNVQAAQGLNKTTADYFHLNYRSANEVTVALLRPIRGPQDIELDLKIRYSYNGVYSGYSVSKIFVYVSEYDF